MNKINCHNDNLENCSAVDSKNITENPSEEGSNFINFIFSSIVLLCEND